MKLEDIRLGQTLTVSHIPEYILSNDGISKILCKTEFDHIINHIGTTGIVCCMWISDNCPKIELTLKDGTFEYFPPEALTIPQHFPSNNDIQVGDFVQIFGSSNTYEVLGIKNSTLETRCVNYPSIMYFDTIYIKASIRPAPKKDQLTIGAACVTTPDAVDFGGTPIPNMLGLIRTFARRDDTIYVSWANNTVGWIERKYIIQL